MSLRVWDAEAAPDPKGLAADPRSGYARHPFQGAGGWGLGAGGLAVACDVRIDAERLAELLAAAVRGTSPDRGQPPLQMPAGGLPQC